MTPPRALLPRPVPLLRQVVPIVRWRPQPASVPPLVDQEAAIAAELHRAGLV